MQIVKIVRTCGPCAGKTTGKAWIQTAVTERGWHVIFVPEAATELISGSVAPKLCADTAAFQKCVFLSQISKERVFETGARTMSFDKILIVCDRGVLDGKAYVTEEEFQTILRETGNNEIELRDSYDAVFHLVTTAKGAEAFYTLANNTARFEDPEMARNIDDKLIAAWTGHPHFRIIDNSTDFVGKMKRLISEIASFLGEPEP